MNPILFLDIDGVLLPRRMYDAPGQTRPFVTQFDPGVVGMLNRLGKDCGARFVIHSSWLRSSFGVEQAGAASVKEHMINQGLEADYFHDDHDCQYKFSGTRWLAIADWLERHKEITKLDYWILEDELFVPDYGINPNRVITTDFNEGFTYKNFMQIYTAEKTS